MVILILEPGNSSKEVEIVVVDKYGGREILCSVLVMKMSCH